MSMPTCVSQLQLGTDLSTARASVVQVSQLSAWSSIKLKQSNITFGRVKCLPSCKLNSVENSKEYHTHTYQRRKTKLLVNAATEFADEAHDEGLVPPETKANSLRRMFEMWYKFSRPYVIKGSVLGVISVSLLAIENFSEFTPSFFIGVLQGIAGICVAALYIGAINEITDIEIDKVNKPYMSLASGRLSDKAAVLITSTYAALGFLLACVVNSWPLRMGIFVWNFFGTLYSLDVPLSRWKKHPVLAAICIWIFNGIVIPIFFHLHAMTNIAGRTVFLSKRAIFVSVMMSISAITMALAKDIPDVEGDRMNGVDTLAIRIGKKKVFWICVGLLEASYAVAALIGLSSPLLWVRYVMVLGHGILGAMLWKNATLVDMESKESTESFYQSIWKLYYAEYLMVPFLRF